MSPTAPASQDTQFKSVYWGPGLGGKTSNLKLLSSGKFPDYYGAMTSTATETERALFVDLVPRGVLLRGSPVRLHLRTTPGAVYYDLSPKLALQGASAVIFVADFQSLRHEANLESIESLVEYLETYGRSIAEIPRALVFRHPGRCQKGSKQS